MAAGMADVVLLVANAIVRASVPLSIPRSVSVVFALRGDCLSVCVLECVSIEVDDVRGHHPSSSTPQTNNNTATTNRTSRRFCTWSSSSTRPSTTRRSSSSCCTSTPRPSIPRPARASGSSSARGSTRYVGVGVRGLDRGGLGGGGWTDLRQPTRRSVSVLCWIGIMHGGLLSCVFSLFCISLSSHTRTQFTQPANHPPTHPQRTALPRADAHAAVGALRPAPRPLGFRAPGADPDGHGRRARARRWGGAVSERARERERECVCVCVCVCDGDGLRRGVCALRGRKGAPFSPVSHPYIDTHPYI
jgi:hypothetical protein